MKTDIRSELQSLTSCSAFVLIEAVTLPEQLKALFVGVAEIARKENGRDSNRFIFKKEDAQHFRN